MTVIEVLRESPERTGLAWRMLQVNLPRDQREELPPCSGTH